ncbi:right-handed parallel beta-helix repeat-containing protein [Geminisphaera colitermitum]|uniref:right-handed parallel beta-helix repeat-containing protein n=1 Tax=Geminisphaera colitermitum TaxID=1148786 RepID=UPI0001965233|nr:right-handed parallel beta-helix repeat-containing protein [Geminisphaera colitermitum]
MLRLLSFFVLAGLLTSASRPTATAAAAAQHIEAAAFGAIPDDGRDDRQALLAAFAECARRPASTLILQKGVYDIAARDGAPPSEIIFFLENIPNLTIEGNGAELRVRTWHSLFRIHDSPGLQIKNLLVDWHPVPHAGGEVVESNPATRSFVLRLAPAYRPAFATPVDLIVGYDPQRKIANPVPTNANYLFTQDKAPKAEPLSDELLRVHLSPTPRTISKLAAAQGDVPLKGTSVALRFRARGATAFLLQNCDNLVVEDVSIYSAPGMGVNVSRCTNVRLSRVRIEPRPGADRWMSTCVDATHFNICRGTILVEDCHWEGQEDDGSNVHNMYMRVYKKPAPRTVQLAGGRGYDAFQPDPEPRPGDLLEFGSDANPYLPAFTARIVNVSHIDTRPDGKARLYTVTTDRDLPADLAPDTLVGNATAIPDTFIMRRTTVRNNRGMGIRVKTRNAIIEDNLFEDTSGAAIWLSCEGEKSSNTAEGVSCRDITLRRNRIIRAGAQFGATGGAIMALTGRQKSHPFVHANLIIEDNIIEDSYGHAIRLTSVDGARITGNKLLRSCLAPIYSDATSRNIVIKNNHVSESQ